MIEQFVRALQATGADPDWRDVADTLWLARHREQHASTTSTDLLTALDSHSTPSEDNTDDLPAASAQPQPRGRVLRAEGDINEPGVPLDLNLRSSDPLPNRLKLGRILRRLKRTQASATETDLDLPATIEHFCETGVLAPLTGPARTRWFQEIAVVVDTSPTMVVWRETVDALVELLEPHGAFSRVTRWTLEHRDGRVGLANSSGAPHAPAVLRDPSARRVTLIVSDCVDVAWHDATMWEIIRDWGRFAPVAILQTLPQRVWAATALGGGVVTLATHRRGEANHGLTVERPWWWSEDAAPSDAIPVCTLDEQSFGEWIDMVAGVPSARVPGALFEGERPAAFVGPSPPDAEQRVAAFRSTASLEAGRLATLPSAVEVSLPLARLVLTELVPTGRQTDLAELLASGLLELPTDADPSTEPYSFRNGVRQVLQRSLTTSQALDVWRTVAPYLERATGTGTPFSRLILDDTNANESREQATPVSAIAADLIDRLNLRAPVEHPAAVRRAEVEQTSQARRERVSGVDTIVVYDNERADLKSRQITDVIERLATEGRLNATPTVIAATLRLECTVALEDVARRGGRAILIAELTDFDGSPKGARILRAAGNWPPIRECTWRIGVSSRTSPSVADWLTRYGAHAMVAFDHGNPDLGVLEEAIAHILELSDPGQSPEKLMVVPPEILTRHSIRREKRLRYALGNDYTPELADAAFRFIEAPIADMALDHASGPYWVRQAMRSEREASRPGQPRPILARQLIAHLRRTNPTMAGMSVTEIRDRLRAVLQHVSDSELDQRIRPETLNLLTRGTVARRLRRRGVGPLTWLTADEHELAVAFLDAADEVLDNAGRRKDGLPADWTESYELVNRVFEVHDYSQLVDLLQLTHWDTTYAVWTLADWWRDEEEQRQRAVLREP